MKRLYGFILALGMILGHIGSLVMERKHLRRHIAILGGSGQGKSKLLELMARQLENQGEGFTYLDPHGDTAEAFMEYLVHRNVDPSRAYYLKPEPGAGFSFDPFAFGPDTESPGYESWLMATVDRIFRAFVRNVSAADQEMMKRLKRWFRNIGYVCGYKINGKYPGLSKALVLTDPDHPDFAAIMDDFRANVRTDIGKIVLADFDKLINTRNHRQREQWVESTINLLRDIFSPPVMQIFDQRAESIDLREVIKKKGMLIVNLRRGDFLSRDQANVIGGILINFLLHAAEQLAEHTPQELRTEHMLIIDECENFIGEDLRMGFAELRKYGLSLCVCVQNVSSLAKGDLDLVAKVFSQCGVFMTFQQGHPDDVEFIAKKIAYGNLDLTPLYTKQVLPDGYMVVSTEGLSLGMSCTVSESNALSQTHTQSRTKQQHTAHSIQHSISEALSKSETEGHTWSETDSTSTGRSSGTNWMEGWSETHQESSSTSHSTARGETHNSGVSEQNSVSHSEGHTTNDATSRRTGDPHETRNHGDGRSQNDARASATGRTSNHGTSASETHGTVNGQSNATGKSGSKGGSEQVSEQNGHAITKGGNSAVTNGQTLTKGTGTGFTEGFSNGESEGESRGKTKTAAIAQGHTITRSFNATPLAMQRIEILPSGKCIRAVQDQLYGVMNTLASLPDRMVLVSVKSMRHPFLLKVHEVVDPYVQRGLRRSLAWRQDDVRLLLLKIVAAHRFYIKPDEEDEGDAQVIPFDRPKPQPPAKRELQPTGTDESPML